ncbi:hypothetical protein D918_10037 [Trichuris suis]|nr:hypothetical protein D918_10037 [Trichuris suis]
MFASCGVMLADTAEMWIIDSGATHHMCPDDQYFTKLDQSKAVNPQVRTADGPMTLAAGNGSVTVKLSRNKGLLEKFVARNTFLVPGIKRGVLSVRQMVENQ